MLRRFTSWLAPNLEVAIRRNYISVRNTDSGRSAMTEAPFSCSHLIAADIDILEHAAYQLFKRTAVLGVLSFPRVNVTIGNGVIHHVEQKFIQDALKNAGASQVIFDPPVHSCDEQSAAQRAYVELATRKRRPLL